MYLLLMGICNSSNGFITWQEDIMSGKIRVTVWNEYHHEITNAAVTEIYPEGIHGQIAGFLKNNDDMEVRTATLAEPEHGLSQDIVDNTDVLIWWGHAKHAEVTDEVVTRVQRRVLEGMGLIVLHSGHFSKIFKALMGTNCSLKWREAAEKERLWIIEPSHPITQGLGEYIELPNTEMYGERFDIPSPDELLFVSWFEGGEVFRSGCTWRRGHGKVFYFRPGHETYPIFHNKDVQQVITNGVRWAKPVIIAKHTVPNAQPLEALSVKDVDFALAGMNQNIDGTKI